jgi:uncharacterized protein (TIGR02145 family)
MSGLFAQSQIEGGLGAIWVVVQHEADIYIDDQKVGAGRYFGKLASGEHSVKVDHWQYYPETKKVKIVPGWLEKVSFRLNPRMGKLEVVIPPSGLMVTLDGEKKGKLPLIVKYLIIGEHLLEFDNQILKAQLGVKISENKTLKIEFDTSGYPHPYAEQPIENKLKMYISNAGNKEITETGICWSKEPGVILSRALGHEVLDTGITEYDLTTFMIPELYYVKPYLITSNYTIYGEEMRLLVFSCGYTLTDKRDNESYKTVKIGSQCWMGENLKAIRYTDGKTIPLIEKQSEWKRISYNDKACCYYGNNSANKNTWGLLYTWSAAMNGVDSSIANHTNVQGICPDGWHLPSDSEWKELEINLGMNEVIANEEGWRGTNEGGKLKESGTGHWYYPNATATNSSGFTALPGGYRSKKGDFLNLGSYAYFWSTAEYNSDCALIRTLNNDNSEVYRSIGYKEGGFSVRCLKD